ncbi:terminase small subunit [Brevibacillus fortis]|nr:terminase small subunit [Brevibacillus fortis]
MGKLEETSDSGRDQATEEAMTDELGMSVQRIVAEYMKIAFADISKYVEFGQQDMPMFTEEGKPINDPDAFVEDMLGVEPDDWQQEVLYALAQNCLVSVRSGQGVGKTAMEYGR